jgi:peptidoglycan/xylan/chitin deacetylase (PgdA/CDA1 family)
VNRALVIVLAVVSLAVGSTALTPPARAARHAVILQYHHVDPSTPASTSVTPDRFAAHLQRLADDGFRVAPLPGVIAALRAGEDIPDSTVCLTADDGYANLRTHALPLLEKHGWTMTVFVCTEQVDRGRPLHLGWDDLRVLEDAGWAIASHGTTHEHLVARKPGETEHQWRSRVRENIAGSVARLRAELDDVPPFFAYPYGEYDPALLDVVRDLDLVGFGQHSGAVGPHADLAALPRYPASGPYAEVDDVAFKAATLPLPVIAAEPASPVLPDDVTRPLLTLTVAAGPWQAAGLAAYVSGQGRAELAWQDREANVVTVRARESLPPGRSRYNVTAPHREGGRWFWYSHPWLRTAGGWQDE